MREQTGREEKNRGARETERESKKKEKEEKEEEERREKRGRAPDLNIVYPATSTLPSSPSLVTRDISLVLTTSAKTLSTTLCNKYALVPLTCGRRNCGRHLKALNQLHSLPAYFF